jgi:hypothetical protein
LLQDNAPAHKAASVCELLTQKMLQPFIASLLSRFISARLLSVHQVENKVKRTPLADFAEIQGAVTDELKEFQKKEFSAAFQKLYDRVEACTYVNGANF